MFSIFNTFFYEPLFNLLILIYNFIPGHDIGLVIIVLTLVIKLVLYPLSLKSIKSQKALQDLQPKIEAVKAQYKDQKEKLASEMMKLYKDEKVSPFSSCLPLLIQFPFLIAVYWVFRNGLTDQSLDILYSFVNNPGGINSIAFGFIDLSKSNLILAVLAGVAQFFQVKMLSTKKPEIKVKSSKDEGMMSSMNKQMMYFMPIMTVVIGMGLPSGLMLYWMVNAVFTIGQQLLTFKKKLIPDVEVIDAPDVEVIDTPKS
jgi:YidC/Oxa1 family membrane protein insertase